MNVGDFGEDPEGATPLTDEDLEGLKPVWVADRNDLNQAEAQNINLAFEKYSRRHYELNQLLDDLCIRKLHADMFGDVWTWAGSYRRLETSIGVAPLEIAESVRVLTQNASYWFDTALAQEIDKVVCEIHHKLVQIHPFRNGNGRMTRMYADMLLLSQGLQPFSWGGSNLNEASSTRSAYINALRSADKGDPRPLLAFVRS